MEDIVKRRRDAFKKLHYDIKLKLGKHKSYTYDTSLNRINKETISYTLPITQTPIFNGYEVIGIELVNNQRVYRIVKKELNNNEYRPRKDTARV